jgi:hypothetical protein
MGFLGPPIETIFVSGLMLIELVLLVGGVAAPAPCCPTSWQGSPTSGKVATVEARHLLQHFSTFLAPTDRVPELELLI